jgi:hypothetical protein
MWGEPREDTGEGKGERTGFRSASRHVKQEASLTSVVGLPQTRVLCKQIMFAFKIISGRDWEGETGILQRTAEGKGTYTPSLRSEDILRPRHADHMLVTTRVPHGKMADEGNCSIVHTGHTYSRHDNKEKEYLIQVWHGREHNHMK